MTQPRFLPFAFCLLLFAFPLACATSPAAREGTPPPAMTLQAAPAEKLPPYALQIGDQLAVRFYFNPELNEDAVIRPDGMISLQLIGDVLALGSTPEALASAITERYRGELANPKVTVIVRQVGSRVYVGGEVGKQGVVPLSAGLTVFQAIQEAGGFLTTAHRTQVILIRRGTDGKMKGYEVDMRPVQDGKDPSLDVPLQAFDVVFVPRSKIAEVNLFVEQYINKNMPQIPFVPTIPVF